MTPERRFTLGCAVLVVASELAWLAFLAWAVNGQILFVTSVHGMKGSVATVDLKTEDDEPLRDVALWMPQLGNPVSISNNPRGTVLCDYGWAITVHKAQGSEWGSVLVIEDPCAWSMSRWRYTAATRASEKLTFLSDAARRLPPPPPAKR